MLIPATGHSSYAPIVGGMLISTKRLDSVSIDPATRIATIGAGAKWLAVQAAAASFELTAITGSSPDVGAVGLTLGGGLGPLARSHGFTSDYVRGFTVVTADGAIVDADDRAASRSVLGAARGKGGLGVVTEMRIELVPLALIYAGALYFDEPHIETVLRGWVDWTATAPDEVTSSVALINFPPLEEIPEPLRGRRTIAVRFAYPGRRQTVSDWRAVADARASADRRHRRAPTAEMGVIHSDPDQPIPAWDRGMLLSSIDQEFADELLAQVGPAQQRAIDRGGGATTRWGDPEGCRRWFGGRWAGGRVLPHAHRSSRP